MFANNTAETCTGTGDTLTLTGAVSFTNEAGNTETTLPFSATAADGDVFECVVNDADGVTKVSGVYTYNAASNTLTRNDDWNWNGTTQDNSPSSNIALSSGTHIIRSAPSTRNIYSPSSVDDSFNVTTKIPHNILSEDAAQGFLFEPQTQFTLVRFYARTVITQFVTYIDTASTVTTALRRGIYSVGATGLPEKLLAEAAITGFDTTGVKTTSLPSPLVLLPGRYAFAIAGDLKGVKFRCPGQNNIVGVGSQHSNNGRSTCLYSRLTDYSGGMVDSPSVQEIAGYSSPVGYL